MGTAMLQGTFRGLAEVARDNHDWITWNRARAGARPARGRAVRLAPAPPQAAWWLGGLAFVLFLPGTPYVVTDLVHLRGDVLAARSDVVVLAGVLPMCAAFVCAGFLAYVTSRSTCCGPRCAGAAPDLDGPWFEPSCTPSARSASCSAGSPA